MSNEVYIVESPNNATKHSHPIKRVSQVIKKISQVIKILSVKKKVYKSVKPFKILSVLLPN